MNKKDSLESFLFYFREKNFESSRKFNPGQYRTQHIAGLLREAGNPQKSFKSIHVAGTTGKGSTATYLARSLSDQKTGLFISPHLEILEERISINGDLIPASEFTRIWEFLRSFQNTERLSFFDALTAIAIIYFAEKKISWGVFETGLGGRLDSTNVLEPELTVITEIGMDHENILGNSIEEIAREKAGIIKKNTPVFANVSDQTARSILTREAGQKNSSIYFFNKPDTSDFRLENKLFVKWVYEKFFNTKFPDIDISIKGRVELLKENPMVFFDSAHNLVSIARLTSWLNSCDIASWNIYINTMKERNLMEMAQHLHNHCHKKTLIFLIPFDSPEYYEARDFEGSPIVTPIDDEALRMHLKDSEKAHLVTGSMRLYSYLKSIL